MLPARTADVFVTIVDQKGGGVFTKGHETKEEDAHDSCWKGGGKVLMARLRLGFRARPDPILLWPLFNLFEHVIYHSKGHRKLSKMRYNSGLELNGKFPELVP